MNVCSQKFRPQDRVVLCSEVETSFLDLHQVIPGLSEPGCALPEALFVWRLVLAHVLC